MWARRLLALVVALLCAAGAVGGDPLASPTHATNTAPRRTYAVGTRTATVVDGTRPTPAVPAIDVGGSDRRTLPVTVWYPARGAAASTPTPDARRARGRFPLIVYAPGNSAQAATSPAVVPSWASVGYVVVALDFPVSSRSRGLLDAIDDWPEQPADVRVVLDAALRGNGIAGTGRMIDRRRVGLAGHSLGAITVLGVAFGTDPDRRVDAVVSFAGIPLLAATDVSSRPLPLLLVHGDDDPVVPAARSRAMFAAATGPRALLLVTGGGHSAYLRSPDAETARTVATATTTFWDTTLRRGRGVTGDPDDALRALAAPGRFTVEVGTAPNLRTGRPANGR